MPDGLLRLNFRPRSPVRRTIHLTKKIFSISILTLAISTAPSWADPLFLAGGFNVFVQGDMTLKADVGGRVAVGGNATFTSFAIGSGDGGANGAPLTNDPSRLDLIVGGHANLSNGSVNKGSAHAGSATQSSVGYHTAGAGMQLGPSPIDFAAEFDALADYSQELLALTGDGISERTPWNTVTLRGTDATLNVFDIDASLLANITSLDIFVPTSSTVLFNVSGESLLMKYMGIQVNGGQDNAMSSRMLWNFHELMSLDLKGLAWRGSILAPHADLMLDSGNINGQVIARNVTTGWGGEYHNFGFDGELPWTGGDVPSVPEPVSLLLFGVGATALALRLRATRR